jgi:uncharacterized membrane protein YhhN
VNANLLLAAAGVAAVVDWWAVATSRRTVELVAKPATMALLVVVAAGFGDTAGDVRAWLVVGALFGLVGDVALLGDGETAFVTGLGAFALGHLAYVVAAVSVGFDPAWAIPGLVFVAALLGYRFMSRTLPGAVARGGSALGGAVVFYAIVISAMVVSAWATTVWTAAVGAMAFAISDWVLGYQRFVAPLPGRRLVVMIPYHVGQALLIVGLAAS